MSTSKLEIPIRNILSEQLASAKTEAQGNDIFPSVGEAIDAAHQASLRYQQRPSRIRSVIIDTLREEPTLHLASLTTRSAAETGVDNREDKFLKDKAALDSTPGVEDFITTVLIGDGGVVLFGYSSFDMIGPIAPSTNPTETTINNSISILAVRNGVHFNPYPSAKKVLLKLIAMTEDIAFCCCGIRNFVVTVAKPTFEATQRMMTHPKIVTLAVTDGPSTVVMGMRSGKKVISAGIGNPPYIVGETVGLVKAAKDIISDASPDYNLPYIAEESLIVTDATVERLVQQAQPFGVTFPNSEEVDKLRAVYLPEGIANEKLVDRNPATLLEAAGIPIPAKVPRSLTGIVKADDPRVTSEQLMSMLPVIAVSDFGSVLTLTLKVEGGLYHTTITRPQNMPRLNPATRASQTSIFVKNSPSYARIGAGGEGFTASTIVTSTGEGTTSVCTFARSRRCVLTNDFSIH